MTKWFWTRRRCRAKVMDRRKRASSSSFLVFFALFSGFQCSSLFSGKGANTK